MTGPPTQRPGTLAHPAAAQRSRQTPCIALLVAITFFMENLDATVIATAAWPAGRPAFAGQCRRPGVAQLRQWAALQPIPPASPQHAGAAQTAGLP